MCRLVVDAAPCVQVLTSSLSSSLALRVERSAAGTWLLLAQACCGGGCTVGCHRRPVHTWQRWRRRAAAVTVASVGRRHAQCPGHRLLLCRGTGAACGGLQGHRVVRRLLDSRSRVSPCAACRCALRTRSLVFALHAACIVLRRRLAETQDEEVRPVA